MPVRNHWDAEHGVLLVSLDGAITDEDLIEYARRTAGSDSIPHAHAELIDLRSVESVGVTRQTLQRVADMFGRTDVTPESSRVALVAASDVAYGLSRMYQAFRSDSPLELQVFRRVNDARLWLGLDPE